MPPGVTKMIGDRVWTRTVEVAIDKSLSSAAAGCHGSTVYKIVDSDEPGTFGGVSIQEILGRVLGVGSRVLVTVEVVEDKPISKKCENPWPAHACRMREARKTLARSKP